MKNGARIFLDSGAVIKELSDSYGSRPMVSSHVAKLNPEQRRAVEYGGPNYAEAGPLLIIAGAGSGKTNTLAHRVAHLIANGIDPRRVLLLTFSRRAATEMIRRVERIMAQALGNNARMITGALTWSGTFHAIGARLLREYAPEIGIDPSFTIHDRGRFGRSPGSRSSRPWFLKNGEPLSDQKHMLGNLLAGRECRNALGEVLGSFFPWCVSWGPELRQLFSTYVETKQRQHVLDYDDLLLYWAQMMGEPSIAAHVAERFDHVLVDEYQDTNRLQASILLALKPTGKSLTVVGDDAQSIYSFRAATVRNILDFPGQFHPRAQIFTLERNYRSTQPILAAANAVIDLAEERFTKNLWSDRASVGRPQLVSVRDEADQARYVTETILEDREAGILLKAQAVLFRASHHSAQLEIELSRRNVPFVKFGGLKFLEAAHIKDVLAFLRWAENPRDRVAGFRVIQLLPGVGPATAARLLERLAETPIRCRSSVISIHRLLPPRTGIPFVRPFGLVAGNAAGWPSELDFVCRWYLPHLERRYDDAVMRQADLVQLVQIASTYSTRERFLTELTLDPPDATSDEAGVPLLDEDYLILSTIHSAKGQEWRSVFVLNAIDGCIPSDLGTRSTAEIEEERRLLYVAMTRAKDHLHLILPQRFFAHQQRANGDRHMYTARTRFIPDSILDHFDNRAWPQTPTTTVAANTSRKAVDITARLRRMWR